jgi:PAS domain S-box-containing protein
MDSDGKILQAIFDHAALGIAQIGLDGSWLRVNNRYCEMLGYSEAELLTRKIWDITRPPDYDEVSRGRRHLLEGAISSHTMEKRFVRKDGTIFWGRLNRSLVRDQDNQPQYFIAVVEDITDRIEAERALRDTEQRLTLAQSAAHLGVCEWDLTTNGFVYSEEYARLYGLSPDHPPLTLEELPKHIHPDDRERLQATVSEALERTHAWDIEYRVLWPDGSVHWLHSKGAVFLDASGRPVRSIGVVLDITDGKRAEAALRESEQRFRVTFFQAAVGITQTGLDGEWLLINDRFCEMLGYSQTELRGKNFLDLTHPDDREASRIALRRFLAGEISSWWMKEKRYTRKDGGIVWVRLFISLVRDQHNQPQYFISVLEDITEQKMIEERLRASEARLMEAQNLAKVGSWERHIHSDKIYWSDEIFRILGLTDTPANLPTFLSCVHPKDREKILGTNDKVRSSSAPVEVEYRIIRPDGEVRFVRSIVQGIRDDQGVPVRITGATQDVTGQVKAGELLRESEAYLKNATRLARVGHWQWDIQANHVSGSEEMYRIFGKPPDFTPSFDDFVQTVIPQDRERVTRWVSDCLAEQKRNEIEYQIAWPNGDVRTISCVSEVSLDEEGQPMRMFGACQDVTDVKKNEAKLVQAQEDLRALTARLVDLHELGMKELARELHDDLSQNLAALGREIETLLPPSAQPSRSLSEQAHEVWRRVTKLASDVHSMSQRLHPTILDDLGLREALKEQCWAFSERTGIPVQFESPGEPTRPAADVSLCFYRVAQEGLHNIAKHAGATSVRLMLSSNEGNCTLRIEDNGLGFDPSEAKGKNALGLISMRERARLVNGNFTIRSEYGKGTMLEVSVALKTN